MVSIVSTLVSAGCISLKKKYLIEMELTQMMMMIITSVFIFQNDLVGGDK